MDKTEVTAQKNEPQQNAMRSNVTQPGSLSFLHATQSPLVAPSKSISCLTHPLIQRKLKVGPVNDKYEQEADRVAEEVMRMPESGFSALAGAPPPPGTGNNDNAAVQRTGTNYTSDFISAKREEHQVALENLCPACCVQAKPVTETITPRVQRQESEKKGEEETIQAKLVGQVPEVSPDTADGIQSLKSGGQPLSESNRNFFEPKFGHDFSKVRIHCDSRAASLARNINAKAFTLGHNIVFAAGQYQPQSFEGTRLMAHEMVHTIQQGSSMPLAQSRISRREYTPERSTDTTTSTFIGSGKLIHELWQPSAINKRPAQRTVTIDGYQQYSRINSHVDRQRIGYELGVSQLPSAQIQRYPEYLLRRDELRQRAAELDDEQLAARIAALRAYGHEPERAEDTLPPEEEQEMHEPSFSLLRPDRSLLPSSLNPDSLQEEELEALLWEQRRRQRQREREQAISALDNLESGWHIQFPASTAGELRVRPGRAVRPRRGRENPELQYPRRLPPGMEPLTGVEGTDTARIRQEYIERVRQRLAAIEIPTATGELRLWGGRGQRERNELPGFVWGHRHDLPAGLADDYQAFWQQAMAAQTQEEAAAVGVTLDTRQQQQIWQVFRFITGEGDIAAINTWDNQLVTLGAGFSARARNAQQLYLRMPVAFHRILYQHGIAIDPETEEFLVLDLNRGSVERGDNALQLLRVDQARLALLINTSMSTQDIDTGDPNQPRASIRELLLAANFMQFQQIHRQAVRSREVWNWPESHRLYAFLLHHWMGIIDWPGLIATGGDPTRMAQYAYRVLMRLPRFHGREDEIWRRISRAARRAHAGNVGNRPE